MSSVLVILYAEWNKIAAVAKTESGFEAFVDCFPPDKFTSKEAG